MNALVDEYGLPVHIVPSAGQSHDLTAAPGLTSGLQCRQVVADRGYDSNAFLDLVRASGAKTHIPTPSYRIIQRTLGRRVFLAH